MFYPKIWFFVLDHDCVVFHRKLILALVGLVSFESITYQLLKCLACKVDFDYLADNRIEIRDYIVRNKALITLETGLSVRRPVSHFSPISAYMDVHFASSHSINYTF